MSKAHAPDKNGPENLVIKWKPQKTFFVFCALALAVLLLVWLSFTMGSLFVKLAAVFVGLTGLCVCGVMLAKGMLPPSLIADARGIRVNGALILWERVAYISACSPHNQACGKKLAALSEAEAAAMDGQLYEELETCAILKDEPGVYVGIKDAPPGQSEVSLSSFFKPAMFDEAVKKLNGMLRYHTS